MKTFILLLCLIPVAVIAQKREKPRPAIYLAYQPFDHGLGIRGDYHLTSWVGMYSSVSYGTLSLYKYTGLQDHMKYTVGVLIPLQDSNGNQHDFSIGGNYHTVQRNPDYSGQQPASDKILYPFSFEAGLTIKFPRITLAFRTDILRWEPCIDVGIPIGKISD